MSRLDEIKRAYRYKYKLNKDTYPAWLINRVDELEEYNEALQETSILNANKVVGMYEQNQRYKQALERAKEQLLDNTINVSDCAENAYYTINRALKEDKPK